MYFIRSGNINLYYGILTSAGFSGYVLTSTAYPLLANIIYDLSIYQPQFHPSGTSERIYVGLSLCFYNSHVYFARSGDIYLSNNAVWAAGHGGYYWSPTINPVNTNAYAAFHALFDRASIRPASTSDHYNGLPLRHLQER